MNVKKSDPLEPDSDVDLENDAKPIRDYINIIIISKSYIAHVSTKQGT